MGYRWLVSSRVDEGDGGFYFEQRTARSIVGMVRAVLDVRRSGETLILIEWRPRWQ